MPERLAENTFSAHESHEGHETNFLILPTEYTETTE